MKLEYYKEISGDSKPIYIKRLNSYIITTWNEIYLYSSKFEILKHIEVKDFIFSFILSKDESKAFMYTYDGYLYIFDIDLFSIIEDFYLCENVIYSKNYHPDYVIATGRQLFLTNDEKYLVISNDEYSINFFDTKTLNKEFSLTIQNQETKENEFIYYLKFYHEINKLIVVTGGYYKYLYSIDFNNNYKIEKIKESLIPKNMTNIIFLNDSHISYCSHYTDEPSLLYIYDINKKENILKTIFTFTSWSVAKYKNYLLYASDKDYPNNSYNLSYLNTDTKEMKDFTNVYLKHNDLYVCEYNNYLLNNDILSKNTEVFKIID